MGLEIVIPAKRNWFITLFIGAWLCGWLVGEIMAPTSFLLGARDAGTRLFIVAWFVMWTIGGGFAIYIFLWSLVGRERVLVSSSLLTIKREVFGLGRLREYELAHVSDVRVSPRTYNPFDFRSGLQFWGVGGGAIAFDHGAATVRFGAALEEGEAKSIVARMRSRARFSSAAV
jgi:hypothetical protein